MLLLDVIYEAISVWPLRLALYVDDLTIDAEGYDQRVEAMTSGATDHAADLLERDMLLQVSPTTSAAVAGKPKLAKRIAAATRSRKLQSPRQTKLLGAPSGGPEAGGPCTGRAAGHLPQ